MNKVVIASNEAEAAAVAAVEQHHAQLAGALNLRVEALLGSVSPGDPAADHERHELVAWCDRELIPHALAEEKALYPAAHGKAEARLLVDGMLDEHRVITGLVREISSPPELGEGGSSRPPTPGDVRRTPGEGERADPSVAGPRRPTSPSPTSWPGCTSCSVARARAVTPGTRTRTGTAAAAARSTARLPGARRPGHPARHPARHDLRGAGLGPPGRRAGTDRTARPASPAGPARAAHPGPVRGPLPRARPGDLAAAVRPRR